MYNGNEFATGWSRQTLQYVCNEAGSVLAQLAADKQQGLRPGEDKLTVVMEEGEEVEAQDGEKHEKETQEKGE